MTLHCDACGNNWIPRNESGMPLRCPFCGSRHWNRKWDALDIGSKKDSTVRLATTIPLRRPRPMMKVRSKWQRGCHRTLSRIPVCLTSLRLKSGRRRFMTMCKIGGSVDRSHTLSQCYNSKNISNKICWGTFMQQVHPHYIHETPRDTTSIKVGSITIPHNQSIVFV